MESPKPASVSTGDFDTFHQVFALVGPDMRTEIPVTVDMVNWLYRQALESEINYGVQIGASFIMLLVVLTLTPRSRLARIHAILILSGLTLNAIRCMLLSLFFTSTWFEFYTLLSGDYSRVPGNDYIVSVLATLLGLPVLCLVLATLAIQAWSMLKLWPEFYKWTTAVASGFVMLATVGFRIASVVIQSKSILYGDTDLRAIVWVNEASLILMSVAMSWFCFMFVLRLVLHMWSNRSILPSVKGLSAMEVLVMTNGVLMLVPIIFASLELANISQFQSGSLSITSVIVILPLGSLVAQRLASPELKFHTPSLTANTFESLHTNNALLRARNGVTSHAVSEKVIFDPIDRELARIDEEMGYGVRVNHQIEHKEERLSETSEDSENSELGVSK